MNQGSFDPTAMEAVAAAPDAPKCVVLLHSKYKEDEKVSLPVRKGMTLNDVIAQTDAARRFSGMNISLRRMDPQGRIIKMPAHYNRQKRAIEVSENYAVFANDRVLIEDNPQNLFTKAIDSVTEGNVLFR